jgi:ribonuclease P protein component
LRRRPPQNEGDLRGVTADSPRPSRPAGSAKREHKLRKRAEFLRVQDGGARVSTAHFLLLFLGRTEVGPSRFGVVASRKIGNAVVRNRAKRLVREAIGRHPELLPREPPGPIDLVVIVRMGAHLLRLADVERELAGAARTLSRRASQLRRAPT